jgi:hypothetical protein
MRNLSFILVVALLLLLAVAQPQHIGVLGNGQFEGSGSGNGAICGLEIQSVEHLRVFPRLIERGSIEAYIATRKKSASKASFMRMMMEKIRSRACSMPTETMSDVFPKEIELDEYFGDDMDRPLERGKSVPVRRVIDGMIKADLKNVLVLG